VLAVDALPIRPEDVDPIVDAIAAAYPEYTRVHARRLALTNVVLPVWASRARHPAERELARRRAEASARALAAGERLEGVQPWRQELELDGHLASIDFDLWLAARRLDVGTWSEPIELVGRWAVVLVEAREEGPSPAATRFLLRVHRFPFVGTERDYYLDAQDALDAAVEACRLTLVDPVWGEAVPETWRRRMSGS
jgi:hypothetical protein